MSLPLRIFLIAICVAFLGYVLLMVRRERFLLKYAIVWVLLAVLGVLAAIFPEGVGWFSSLLGFETPVNFAFLVCIVFLMVASIMLVAALSKQSLLVKKLVQEVSILRAEADGTVETGSERRR